MKNFTLSEFNCKETGENKMNPKFLEMIDKLRERCGFPFVVESGFRSAKHSIEVKKKSPGTHSKGIAADIRVVGGYQRYKIVSEAINMGFSGIGVDENFIHVDIREDTPVVWSY